MTTAITETRTIYACDLSDAARAEIRAESASWPESGGVAVCCDPALEAQLRFAGPHNVLDALTSGRVTLSAAHAAYVALWSALRDVRWYDGEYRATREARDAVWSTIRAHSVVAVEVGLRLVPGKLDVMEVLALLSDCGVKHPSER